MTRPLAILWFRQDLRLGDHAALSAAANDGCRILPVYILDDETPGAWRMGGASRWWLHESLSTLRQDIASGGGTLILRRGASRQVLRQLVSETGAKAVYFTRCYEPYAARLEQHLHDDLKKSGVEPRRFGGGVLFEPEKVRTRAGEPFRVFTPFYQACLREPAPRGPAVKPENICWAKPDIATDRLADWRLQPSRPDWAGGLRESWSPGERGAHLRLTDFLDESLSDYAASRDYPARTGTSRLSAHLHFGEVSPRQLWHAVEAWRMKNPERPHKGANTFIKELLWREFSVHLLSQFPELPAQSFRPQFDGFPWAGNSQALRAWQKGRTGYPIVDAGMRELWHTGYMHNRVRMIAASFLIKDLLIDWRDGEAWFWDTLVDADLANNAASWQWVAGSGADAAPYFRIFNPVLQSQKFDARGAYLRKWLPELADLSGKDIHAPWTASPVSLSEAGVTLGKTYPFPIVDHAEARRNALARYETVKESST